MHGAILTGSRMQLWQGSNADNDLRLHAKKTKFVSSEMCTGPILDFRREAIENMD